MGRRARGARAPPQIFTVGQLKQCKIRAKLKNWKMFEKLKNQFLYFRENYVMLGEILWYVRKIFWGKNINV